ncbi:uncharacterized protein H6S33_008125, partial [Morchella sextelata]|uniref:uncharacterized protein n=1 Tax=Morchella sextelata TaxID=1174677 RepID=UPI001D0492DC
SSVRISYNSSSDRKTSSKTIKPIPEKIPKIPSKQSPVLSKFTPINKSRKHNPVPSPIRSELWTPPNINLAPSYTEGIFPSNWGATLTDSDSFPDFGSELSEPYRSDDQDSATGSVRGPPAAVSTASSERTNASSEPLVWTTVLRVSATPSPTASAPRKNVPRNIIVPCQVLTRSKSSAACSRCPTATGPATGPPIGLAGSTTPSPVPVTDLLKALALETPIFKPLHPSQ